MQASSCTCHLGTCLDHGTAPKPSAPATEPRPAPPWPAWVELVVREHERLVRAGDILGAALHVGGWPDGLRECQCMTGETEGPDGRWRTCSACEGWIYLWDAPEGAEREAA